MSSRTEKTESKSIYLDGCEVRLNGDEQCQRFLQTQAIDKKAAKKIVLATKLVFENNKLTKAFKYEEGEKKKRDLDEDEVGMGYIDVKPHQMYDVSYTDTSSSYLGGDCPDTFKMPKFDFVAPFQYLGMLSNKEKPFRWLPFDLHLSAPIYLFFDTLFIDYSDPNNPIVINEDELKDCGNYIEKVLKPDSKIVFEKSPISIRKTKYYGYHHGYGGIGLCGVPCWIQYPSIPTCPKSNKTMKFLIQLRSNIELFTTKTNIPSEDDWVSLSLEQMNFWGEGDLFVFFEPESKVACYLIQTT